MVNNAYIQVSLWNVLYELTTTEEERNQLKDDNTPCHLEQVAADTNPTEIVADDDTCRIYYIIRCKKYAAIIMIVAMY